MGQTSGDAPTASVSPRRFVQVLEKTLTRIPLEDLFRRAVDIIEGQHVTYLVYGGLAIPAWGEVLTTDDADFVVRVDVESAARLILAFRSAGFSFPPNAETLFPIDTWTRASLEGREADLALADTPFDAEALSRAVRLEIYGRTVPIATAEDLILYKLSAYRHKDLGHVEDIIIRQGARLNLSYLRHWASEIANATGKFEVPSTLANMLAAEGLA